MEKFIEILYSRQKRIIDEKRREESHIYSGRENEISTIESRLLVSQSKKSKSILNIHGPDLIGKSRLLKQFRNNQDSKFLPKYLSYVDFFLNFKLRNKPISFLTKIVNDWDSSNSLFNEFRANKILLKEIINRNAEKFRKICQEEEILRKSEALTANKIINSNLLEEIIRHNLDIREIDFILNYFKKQEEVFFREVEKIYQHEGRHSIIIIDDLDDCSSSIVSLIQRMVERFKNKIFFIITTREPISWINEADNDNKATYSIEYLELQPLKTNDIVTYLLNKEIYEKDIQNLIIDTAKGFPFIMEMLIEAINLLKKQTLTISNKEIIKFFSIPDIMHINSEIVIAEFILKKINEIFTIRDKKFKNLIYKLGIPRYFSDEILFLIAESRDEKTAGFFVDLVGMPFVYSSPKEDNNWKYHNLIRKICVNLEKEPDLHDLHDKLYKYFRDKNEYISEIIYHQYQLKPLESIEKIINIFNENMQTLKIQKATDVLDDFFSYYTEVSKQVEPEEIGLIYSSLANMFVNLLEKDKTLNIEKSIIIYNKVLEIYNKTNNLISYGYTLKKLAHAYNDLFLLLENDHYLILSIETNVKALSIFNIEKFPIEFANLKRTIGLALTKFHTTEIDNLKKAISYFEEANIIYIQNNLSLDIAITKSYLADVFNKMASVADYDANLQVSLNFYNEALLIYKSMKIETKTAETLKNIGIINYKIKQNKTLHLSKAIDAFEAALLIFRREKFPAEFVEIKKYLGLSYYYLFNRTKEYIEKALLCFKEAIEVIDKEKNKTDYARLSFYLGNCYGRLQYGDRIQNLKQALALYDIAQNLLVKERYPYEFAEILDTQGMVYLELPGENRKENIKKAVTMFKKALEIRAKDVYPEEYAASQMNLGSAYQELIFVDETVNPQDAISSYKEALTIFNKEKYLLNYVIINNNIGTILEKIAINAFMTKDFEKFKNYLGKSQNSYNEAVNHIDKKVYTHFYEIFARNLDRIIKLSEKINIE